MSVSLIDAPIKFLTLAGGGFYGYAHVGALSELAKYPHLLDVTDIRGVSVGSIVAALYAVGYTAAELTPILFEMDFDSLIRDCSFPYLNLRLKLGLYEANKLEQEVERLISIKTNIRYCTFSQTKIELTIFSTNLNYQCPRAFNKANTPRMPISKAVRLSVGYPIVMTPVLFEGDYYGDGGEYMNYPISTIEPRYLKQTLGFTFAAFNENKNGTLKTRIPIKDIMDYGKSLGLTMSRAAYVSQMNDETVDRTIVIHITENIDSMQFNLSREDKEFLYECGVKAVKEQLGAIVGSSRLDDGLDPAKQPLVFPLSNSLL